MVAAVNGDDDDDDDDNDDDDDKDDDDGGGGGGGGGGGNMNRHLRLSRSPIFCAYRICVRSNFRTTSVKNSDKWRQHARAC